MLKQIVFATALIGSLSLSANETKTFNDDSLQLLNAVYLNCPIQFIQAMKGANRVGTASYRSTENSQTYELTTVAGGYAPSFQSYDVATLKIFRTVVPSPSIPDKPTQWNIRCDLESAKAKRD